MQTRFNILPYIYQFLYSYCFHMLLYNSLSIQYFSNAKFLVLFSKFILVIFNKMALLSSQWLHPLYQFQISTTNIIYKNILTHISTQTTVAKHLIKIYSYDFTNQYNQFQWRYQTTIPIFKPYHAHLVRIMRQSAIVCIFIECPYYLLSAVSELSLNQTIQILKTMMCALPMLISRYGYFQITEYMVGFNNNQSKIWVNQDLTANKPQYKAENEQEMVLEIVVMLKNRTEISSQSTYFFNRISKLGYKLSSIIEILKQIDKIDQDSNNYQQQFTEMAQQVISELGSISENVTNESQESFIEGIPLTSTIQKQQDQIKQQQQQHLSSSIFSIKCSNNSPNQKVQIADSNKNMDSTQATSISHNQIYGLSPTQIKLAVHRVNQIEIKPCLFKPNVKNIKHTFNNPEIIQTQQSIAFDEQINFPSILDSKNWKNNFQILLKKNKSVFASIQIEDKHKKYKEKYKKQLKLEKYGCVNQVFLSIVQDEIITI